MACCYEMDSPLPRLQEEPAQPHPRHVAKIGGYIHRNFFVVVRREPSLDAGDRYPRFVIGAPCSRENVRPHGSTEFRASFLDIPAHLASQGFRSLFGRICRAFFAEPCREDIVVMMVRVSWPDYLAEKGIASSSTSISTLFCDPVVRIGNQIYFHVCLRTKIII